MVVEHGQKVVATPTLIGTAGEDITTLLLSMNTTVSDDSVAVELERETLLCHEFSTWLAKQDELQCKTMREQMH